MQLLRNYSLTIEMNMYQAKYLCSRPIVTVQDILSSILKMKTARYETTYIK